MLHFTRLPENLVKLCELKNFNTVKLTSFISDLSYRDRSFFFLVERLLNISFEDDLQKHMAQSSFEEFRNIIASAYLSHAKFGDFFELNDIQEDMDKVLELEKRFMSYFPSNDSMFFLFLIYLKLCDYAHEKLGVQRNFHGYDFDYIESFLKLSEKRSTRLDWLFIQLHSYIELFGSEAKKTITNEKNDIFQFLEKLENDKKQLIIQNHLEYAYALGDKSYFLFDVGGA